MTNTPSRPNLAGPSNVDELLERAARDVEGGWLPACQVAVARWGELLAFQTFGDATNDTRFCVFSATKPLVASAIWLLIGDGALQVHRPVAHYVQAFNRDGLQDVTVSQILLHTAGLPHAPMWPDEGADRARRLQRMSRWELEWEPGSRFEYHALSAHWVLAELLDALTDEDYRDVIEQRICAPIGLPRLLGRPVGDQPEVAPMTWVGAAQGGEGAGDLSFRFDDPEVIAAGVPGGGGVATAEEIVRFYQALLDDRTGIWDPDTRADGTAHIRCRFPDPDLGVPVNRTLGLVVAGDDGLQTLRYGAFAEGCSPRAFGHAGAHVQVAWADPATGISFCYLTNGLDSDTMREGMRGLSLSNIAARLTS